MKKLFLTVTIAFMTVSFIESCTNKEDFIVREVNCTGDTLYKMPRTEHISDGAIVSKYFSVWKEMIMDESNLTGDFFDKHIKVFYLDTSVYKNTAYLNIGFEYGSEWASANVYNEIIIRINNQLSPFYEEGIPINKDLTKQQIIQVGNIKNNEMGNRTYKISGNADIKYDFISAKELLRGKVNVSKLCNPWCTINEQGNLSLNYSDNYFDKKQYCTSADLDLITGAINVNNYECVLDYGMAKKPQEPSFLH